MRTSNRLSRQWGGFSLLEVVMAMLVIALILVPTASMMSTALRGENTREKRSQLSYLAHGKLEETCHLARVQFHDRTAQGTFADRGHADIRYSVTASDSADRGGLPGRLQVIEVTAWYDEDADQALDDAETRVNLWTAVARATP